MWIVVGANLSWIPPPDPLRRVVEDRLPPNAKSQLDADHVSPENRLHRRHNGEPSSHHSVQATTALILTNNIMVFPRIYHNLGKPIILLVNLKHRRSITISLPESWHGGDLKVNT